jgi:hypothetical protein
MSKKVLRVRVFRRPNVPHLQQTRAKRSANGVPLLFESGVSRPSLALVTRGDRPEKQSLTEVKIIQAEFREKIVPHL